MKAIRMEMSDGTTWEIPIEVIANKFASTMACSIAKDNGKKFDRAYIAWRDYALANETDLLYFLENSMDWDEIQSLATPI